MSVQLGIFLAIALVVGCGFAWYERSRPDSRMIALVAALAALAVAGRLVLTPVPNVVATTDIALITGYVLGAAPGFAVGALAAPISNMWLGQGPWTIWQMAGWGLAGLLGAALARYGGRHFGRLGLATACALMGFVYGALLDLSVMVSYGGEQSLDRYLAFSARGIPFNVAHAAGNFVIAFAAGPALVRMISRYRERLSFRWHPAGALPAIALLAVLGSLAIPAPQTAEAASGAGAAASWLRSAQESDGGYPAGPGSPASTTMTGWSMLGLEAAGINPSDVAKGGASATGYLRANIKGVNSVGDLERTILAVVGAGENPRSFAGRDLLSELERQRGSDGSYQGQVNLTSFAILALGASGDRSTAASTRWLAKAQGSSGGWGYRPGVSGEADSTGAALQGLRAGGGSRSALKRGAKFLGRTQAPDGGWTLAGSTSNSQSTAWAIQGLIAAGANPGAVSNSGHSGFDYLSARQAPDGHYRYSASTDQTPVWVTAQVMLAVERKALPLAAVARAPRSHNSHKGGENDPNPSSPGAGGGSGRNGNGDNKNSTTPGATPNTSSGPDSPNNSASKHHGPGSRNHPGGGNPGSGPGRGPPATTPGQSPAASSDQGSQLVKASADGAGAAADSGDSSGPSTALLLGGFAVLVGLGGGWFWYRQRIT